MSTMHDHYASHLGPIYTWMVGDLDAAFARADGELEAIGLPAAGGPAVDLGAGFGLHALPLARRGRAVIAVDSCRDLLDALAAHAAGLDIRVVEDDLLRFRRHIPAPAAIVLCMGDTLTHLPSRAAVTTLLGETAAALAPGGVFVTTFRDYVSAPARGSGRFVSVRSDADRILTCFLEYGDDTVEVHDIVHERATDGWTLRVSSYPKLRLDPDWVVAECARTGLAARREAGLAGMVRVVARRDGA